VLLVDASPAASLRSRSGVPRLLGSYVAAVPITVHNKLVRDRIPEIITAAGSRVRARTLDASEIKPGLIAKIAEEAEELRAAEAAAVLGELCDLLEILRAYAIESGLEWGDVDRAADEKRSVRGAFSARTFLEHVDGPAYHGE
jgi:predicted house-cleaning noncanonical NTP pyrophosphatase (MazG superfamily)